MVRNYCTYFDSNYLPFGLTLLESLRRHSKPFVLHILCLDDAAYEYFVAARLDEVRPIRLRDLEAWDPALLAVKPTRGRVEYFFTCTPDLVRYVMDRDVRIGDVTYLDADLFFFADPKPIFDEIGSASVGIISHRFAPDQAYLEKFGHYNVGFLFFRTDSEGQRCLQWWRDRCLEWCFDRVEDGKFADQKYLDQWPALFQGVVVIQNPGAGLAPWNRANYSVGSDGRTVYADGVPLIFYHFHGLRFVTGGLLKYVGYMSPTLKSKVYVPYIRELRRARAGTRSVARHQMTSGTARSARSVIHERFLVVAGPVALEIRFDRVVKPLGRIYRAVRKLAGSA